MKNFAKRVSALVLALVVGAAALCPAALAAASLPDLPKDECVVDDANILSDSTTQTIVDLNNQLQSVRRSVLRCSWSPAATEHRSAY